MPRFSHLLTLGLALLGYTACGAAPTTTPAHAANSVDAGEQLGKIVDRYWDERAARGAEISPRAIADSWALERGYLTDISAVPRTALDAKSRLTYDIFKRQRELAVEGFTYPSELLAVEPFSGMPQQMAEMAAATAQPPAVGGRDYEIWLHRIDDFASWAPQAIVNMREGIRRGYLTPRAVVERTVAALERLGSDTPSNVFYRHLGAALGGAVKDKLLPANRSLHDFLQGEYLPRARPGLALAGLPLGQRWYAYLVRVKAGANVTPIEIHNIGLMEVERLRARMASMPAVATAATATATAAATTPAIGATLAAYMDLKVQTLAAMPTVFKDTPPADFEIRAAELSIAPAQLLVYLPVVPGGGRPGILYVATAFNASHAAPLSTANFLQEAIPGLHYQSSIQQAKSDLPKFRRFGTEPAFVEGWGLYAASLGEELGLYRDEETRAGALGAQLRCAAALVVDTGLHALNWTRVQALDYLRVQLGLDEAAANLLIDRFAALPGDGLACKLGELKFQALRLRAQQALGTGFNIREFHSEILNDGAMPLDILEAKMQVWLDGRR
ncbi:MAG: DUF885 family protein [Pseudomonadota bacterium]|nr:DUF885 family protein [Pseudomonadota bacterium]